MDSLVIVGASGQGRVVVDIVELEARYRIAGLVDRAWKPGDQLLGHPVLGREDDLPRLINEVGITHAIVAIGDNFTRARVTARIEAMCPQLRFASAVHPRASVSRSAVIGSGTMLMAGAVVNACCIVGRSCIVNTVASLGHDSRMGDFASIGPNASVGGGATVGAFSAIGIGAVVLHGVSVGEHSVIGAGATAVRNIGSHVVAYGSPARVIRPRHPGDRYL